MDVRSDTQRQDQERTHPRNNESDAGSRKIMERQFNWYGHLMGRDEEHVPRKVLRTDISTEKIESTTENKTERGVPTGLEKYWAESRRGEGQGDVEKEYLQSNRRPYMMRTGDSR